MITEIIEKWEENKHKLEEYFKTTSQDECGQSYSKLVKTIFEICFSDFDDNGFDIEKITVIDHGDYQGTQIFIIPLNTYQPDVNSYVYTHNYYGSCSGCDTLQAIYYRGTDLPDENQVSEYMTLSLHLVQKLKWLGE